MKKRENYTWVYAVILLLLFLVSLNIRMRERIYLDDFQKNVLLNFFSEEHIDSIKFYRGGMVSLGSTRVLCNNIYFNPRTSSYFFEDNISSDSLSFLVHETTHTFQSRKSCLSVVVSSLSNQLFAYFKHGSRNYAYLYSINESLENFNVEQEASLVEDYFQLSFADENQTIYINCLNCDNYTSEELFFIFKERFNEIILKYS